MAQRGGSERQLTLGDALSYVKTVKETFRDKGEKFDEFFQVLDHSETHRDDVAVVIERMKDLFEGDRNLILGFNVFVPKGYKAISVPLEDEEPPQNKADTYEEALILVKKIKARFQGDERVYESFVGIIHAYISENKKSLDGVLDEFEVLFQGHKDLLEELGRFVSTHPRPRSGEERFGLRPTPASRDGKNSTKKSLWNKGHQPKPAKYEDRDRERVDEAKEKDPENRKRDKRDEVVKGVAKKRSIFPDKDKNVGKCISELNLSYSKRCTPSYRLLPNNCPQRSAPRERRKPDAEVLNDDWVSVPSGIAGYNFKQTEKNKYEEIMFQCEDDRYDMDMQIESMKSAAESVEKLMEKINSDTIKTDIPIRLDEHFTAMNLRCIERLDGVHGHDMIGLLRKKTRRALPVLLNRFRQKQQEYERERLKFDKVCAKVYARNHHKALNSG